MSEDIFDLVKKDNSTIIEVSNKLKELDNLNLTTQAQAARNLLGQNIIYEKVCNAQGNIIYKQFIRNEALENKLIEIGEYDEEGLMKLMMKKDREKKNIEKFDIVKNLVLKELELSKAQLK